MTDWTGVSYAMFSVELVETGLRLANRCRTLVARLETARADGLDSHCQGLDFILLHCFVKAGRCLAFATETIGKDVQRPRQMVMSNIRLDGESQSSGVTQRRPTNGTEAIVSMMDARHWRGLSEKQIEMDVWRGNL